MSELQDLLEAKGIRKAVVIDDVFDDVPRPDELDEDDWTIFFDDLGQDGQELLEGMHPGYSDALQEDLRISPGFIAILWRSREELSLAACGPLFSKYENRNITERTELNAFVTKLDKLGLTCTTTGSGPDESSKDADLIFVDLFLGLHQSEDDMDRAIRRVQGLVQDRRQSPPLVVLMSRSTRLQEKRNDFRDEAGLLGSTFRVVSKAELAGLGKLELMLTRLVSNYEDAKRVAGFVHAWESGLYQARENFIRILRRLDLSDFAQVRALLLDFEGQNLGEYLLDVADRVLQHEIESDPGTISAAREMNKIDLNQYPAPHLAGSPDLQDLVHRMVFQHTERLKLSSDEDLFQIQFGDLLRRKDEEIGTETHTVYLVVTPACDLAREGHEDVLVLPGIPKLLAAKDWSYGSTEAKTPIFISDDGSRFSIKWNLKRRRTVPFADLSGKPGEEKIYERLGRVREIYAVELQQRLLADMGRIGQPANPPATFPVSIALYLVSSAGTPSLVEIPELMEAVCFVGRNEKSSGIHHLVLSEQACDALWNTIQKTSSDQVHSAAKHSLATMKADLDFLDRFQRGLLEVPLSDGALKPVKGNGDLIYMHFVRNEWKEETEAVKGDPRKGPFIMKICDIQPNFLVDLG